LTVPAAAPRLAGRVQVSSWLSSFCARPPAARAGCVSGARPTIRTGYRGHLAAGRSGHLVILSDDAHRFENAQDFLDMAAELRPGSHRKAARSRQVHIDDVP